MFANWLVPCGYFLLSIPLFVKNTWTSWIGEDLICDLHRKVSLIFCSIVWAQRSLQTRVPSKNIVLGGIACQDRLVERSDRDIVFYSSFLIPLVHLHQLQFSLPNKFNIHLIYYFPIISSTLYYYFFTISLCITLLLLHYLLYITLLLLH